MMKYQLLFFLTFLFKRIAIIGAWKTFAGTCAAGNFGLGSEHGGSRKTLDQRSLVLKVDGVAVAPNTVFELAQGSHEFTLTSTDGSRTFRGFYFRLAGVNGINTGNMLSENVSSARMNSLCPSNVASVEHTGSSSKSSITVSFFSREVGDYIMDLHAVVSSKSDWVYDRYNFKVVSVGVPTLSPAPSTSLRATQTSSNSSTGPIGAQSIALIAVACVVGGYFGIMLILFAVRSTKTEKEPVIIPVEPEEEWIDIQVLPKSKR